MFIIKNEKFPFRSVNKLKVKYVLTFNLFTDLNRKFSFLIIETHLDFFFFFLNEKCIGNFSSMRNIKKKKKEKKILWDVLKNSGKIKQFICNQPGI